MPVVRRKVDRTRSNKPASTGKKNSFPFTRVSQENDDGSDEDWNEGAGEEKKEEERKTEDTSDHSEQSESSEPSSQNQSKDDDDGESPSSQKEKAPKRKPESKKKKSKKPALQRPDKKTSDTTKTKENTKKPPEASKGDDDWFDSYDDETSYSHQDDSDDEDFHAPPSDEDYHDEEDDDVDGREESSDDEDDDVDDKEEPSDDYLRQKTRSTTRGATKRKPATSARRGRRKQATTNSSESENDEEDAKDDDGSNSEDFVSTKKKKTVQNKPTGRNNKASPKGRNSKTTAPNRRKRVAAAKDTSSEEEEEETEEILMDSEESDFADSPRRKGKAKKKTKTPDRRQKVASNLEDTDSDSATRHKGGRPRSKQQPKRSKNGGGVRRGRAKVAAADDDDEEDERDYSSHRQEVPPIRASPQRKSAQKASLRLMMANSHQESGDEQEETVPQKRRRTRSKEVTGGDSEEEFIDYNEVDLNSEHSETVGIVRDADVGIADDSHSEEEAQSDNPKAARRAYASARGALYESDESSSSDRAAAAAATDSPPKIPKCPSTMDAITTEDLPPVHVCYITPDRSSRFCFALETLRQVALTSDQPKYNSDGKLAFLQPLHFRSQLSDDLVDQIASRFGRDALDINGPYYTRTEESIAGISFNEEAVALAPAYRYERSDFEERVRRFVGSIMGSRDLYVCPLCYTAAYKNMDEGDNAPSRRTSGTKDISKIYSLYYRYDPISILGCLDSNDLAVASTFCFKSVSKVKKHLLDEHEVDPRAVQGNDLYARFAIRKQDGLLQRYIRVDSPQKVHFQGELQRYWLSGNNFDFVHLVDLVDAADEYRKIELKKDEHTVDEVEDAEDFLGRGNSFFDSFHKDVQALWEWISGPYQQQDDMEDFLAEEGSVSGDEEDERMEHREVDRQEMEYDRAEDEERIERYRKMEEEKDNDCGSEGEEPGDDTEEEGSERQESSGGEDDWMATKARRLKHKAHASKKRNARAARAAAVKSKETPSSSDESFGSEVHIASAPTRYSFLMDSEDEELTSLQHLGAKSKALKTRKYIHESDDE